MVSLHLTQISHFTLRLFKAGNEIIHRLAKNHHKSSSEKFICLKLILTRYKCNSYTFFCKCLEKKLWILIGQRFIWLLNAILTAYKDIQQCQEDRLHSKWTRESALKKETPQATFLKEKRSKTFACSFSSFGYIFQNVVQTDSD